MTEGKNIYDSRLKCLSDLIDNTKSTICGEEEYIKISKLENQQFEVGHNTLDYLEKEYKQIYDRCKIILQ